MSTEPSTSGSPAPASGQDTQGKELPSPPAADQEQRDIQGRPFGQEGTNKPVSRPQDRPSAPGQDPLAGDGKHVEPTPFLR